MDGGEKQKKVLQALLDRFVRVCDANNLKYYLAWGSILGAVRHKGMIPWDDDIDVFMPRKDYECLQKLPGSKWGKGYRLASWKETKNYRYDFLKLESEETTLIERIHPDYVGGVFIDIFPVDLYPADPVYISNIERELKHIKDRIIECGIKNDCECNSLFELIGLKIKRFFYNHKATVNRLERLATRAHDEGEMMADFHNYSFLHGGWPASYFGEGTSMEFEGKQYIVPTEWDRFLTHIYGDYMTPPPIEKRGGHSFEFVNYDRRLSDKEIRIELRRIHKKRAYRSSFKKELKFILRVMGFLNVHPVLKERS